MTASKHCRCTVCYSMEVYTPMVTASRLHMHNFFSLLGAWLLIRMSNQWQWLCRSLWIFSCNGIGKGEDIKNFMTLWDCIYIVPPGTLFKFGMYGAFVDKRLIQLNLLTSLLKFIFYITSPVWNYTTSIQNLLKLFWNEIIIYNYVTQNDFIFLYIFNSVLKSISLFRRRKPLSW